MKVITFRDWGVVRFVVRRRRLVLSVLAGAVLMAALPGEMRLTTRYILSWDLTATLYIAATSWMITRSTVEDCRDRAALHDEGDRAILVLVVAAAATSFFCIAAELPALQSPNHSRVLGLVLTALTVALSWTFTHLVFTLHYANIYYRPDEDGFGGLAFPGGRPPDYRDFLYYSFVIGCTAQTADVETVSRLMRKLTMLHGIVAFVFNTAILALTINVGATLLS